MALNVDIVKGPAIRPLIPDLASLRIAVFREYPYLYEGDAAYEERYLRAYSETAASVVVTVRAGDKIVGASTALPLRDAEAAFQIPFKEAGFDTGTLFYFGESVLLPDYRGRGLGTRFFEEREVEARRQGFALATFCVVERPKDHPRRPADYRDLGPFWRRRGFRKQPDLRTTFSWRELDETEETPKPMTFWLKRLE